MNRFEFNTGDHKEEEEKVLVGRSYGKEVLYRFRKNKGAWISFFIIICRQGFRDWKSWEFLMV